MTSEKPEEAMTFGELLQLISEQRRRLSVLEIAFSYISFSLDEKANQLLIHNLMLETQNQNRDVLMQKYFAQLAEELARRVTPVTPPPCAAAGLKMRAAAGLSRLCRYVQ
ncbi:hypothetical protein SGGMMB4_02361 [Sodalis glossinidius str. 'morsitans']|uniref:Uncharacterized protein n=1 Tax=Sodalis glossinidius (strain morsitans) TaxID=343509 RepID=A0A193QIC5_SODGM|nr:hypothetical protein [Sodalis glossinidius]CRL44932.1 hypothetical protein SGGMMB4_02361 [Sodalis glossinidius str. 'morsitans']